MSNYLPSRWYRTLYDKSDISDFVQHLRALAQFSIKDREYPASIAISGEAYYLFKTIYKASENRLEKFMISIFVGNPYIQAAKNLGSIFVDYIRDANDITKENVKYIHSYYLVLNTDNGYSALIHYADSFAIDNHYWEPGATY